MKKLLILFALLIPMMSSNSFTQEKKTLEDYIVDRFIDETGREVVCIIVPGRPPEGYRAPSVEVPGIEQRKKGRKNTKDQMLTTYSLSNVPAFNWCYGCSATSGAMMAGFYDNQNYPNMYTGPANSGVVPQDNSTWGYGECPLSATHSGYDGRTARGHVDDYWVSYGSGADDPYISNGWTQHTWGDCTADYMGTNQSAHNVTDGATRFYYYSSGAPLYNFSAPSPNIDGCYGLRQFFESRGYEISSNYNQWIYGYNGNTLGFTFDDFCEQIDKGFPVLIHVEGHTMLGYGYNTTSEEIYLHDTWDHNDHEMDWGGAYPYGQDELQHYGVSVFEFECPIEREIPTTTVATGSSDDLSASTNVYAAYSTNTLTVQGNGSDAGGSLTMKASESIHLYPGFKVQKGGSFSANIQSDPCSTDVSSKIAMQDRPEQKKLDIFAGNPFSIAPNPNSGVFDINILKSDISDFSLEIYNSIGDVVVSERLSDQRTIRINMSNHPSGVYFIKIITRDNVYSEKFMIL